MSTIYGPDMVARALDFFGAHDRPMVSTAISFAHDAHASIDQRRKHTGDPYFVHPMAVAAQVDAFTGDDVLVAVAFMHDVVEDTPVTIDDVASAFARYPCGAAVVAGVAAMTDPDVKVGNRATRKSMTRQRMAAASPGVQVVKACDVADNAISLAQFDPNFFAVFTREVNAMFAVFDHTDATVMAAIAAAQAVMG